MRCKITKYSAISDSYEINSYLCMTYLQLVRLWKICIRYRSPSIRIIPQNICRKCLTP